MDTKKERCENSLTRIYELEMVKRGSGYPVVNISYGFNYNCFFFFHHAKEK